MQKGVDIEHIVIDGGSTDGTLEFLKKNIHLFSRLISEPDRGLYDAMNKGLAIATGEVIGFLHSGDVYENDKVLASVMKVMESEGLDAVYADIAFFKPSDPLKALRRYRSIRFTPQRIAWGWMPAHPSLFIRHQVYERFGRFNTKYKIAGDYEFVARIFKDGKLRYRYIPEILVRMRIGGVSTGGWRNTITLNKEVIRACRENGIYTNWLMLLSKYPFKFLEYFR